MARTNPISIYPADTGGDHKGCVAHPPRGFDHHCDGLGSGDHCGDFLLWHRCCDPLGAALCLRHVLNKSDAGS